MLSNTLHKNKVSPNSLGKLSLKNRETLICCNGKRSDAAVQSVCETSGESVSLALSLCQRHLIWSSSSWAGDNKRLGKKGSQVL